MHFIKSFRFLVSGRNLLHRSCKERALAYRNSAKSYDFKYCPFQHPIRVLRTFSMSETGHSSDSTGNDFYFLDTSASPIIIDIDSSNRYRNRTKTSNKEKCKIEIKKHKSHLKERKHLKKTLHDNKEEKLSKSNNKEEKLSKSNLKIKMKLKRKIKEKKKAHLMSSKKKREFRQAKLSPKISDDDDDDIIYEGTYSKNYLSLNVSNSKSFFRNHLLESSKINVIPERSCSSNSKNKNENAPEIDCISVSDSRSNSEDESDSDVIIEDDSKIVNGITNSNICDNKAFTATDRSKDAEVKMLPCNATYGDRMMKNEVNSSEDSCQYNDGVEGSSRISKLVASDEACDSDTLEGKTTKFKGSRKNNSEKILATQVSSLDIDFDDDDNDELNDNEENYESINMDIDTDNNDSGSDVAIDVKDSDFVPLKQFRLKDIQKDVYISDSILESRRKLESMRRWELTGLGYEVFNNNKEVDGTIFTILSYNVLAQGLIRDNMFLYEHCNPDYLEWEYRWPLLQHEIRHLQPDIMTFQEVESTHFHTHYLPWFDYLGYKSIFKKRTGTKIDGCAIIFNEKKFKLIEETSVEYNQPKAMGILNRDNIGLIVKLTPTEFYHPFCVATTHILFNPRRVDVKLAQVVLLLTELDRICYEEESGGRPVYCPLILTGDFNTEPYSKLISFIRNGKLEYSGMSRRTLRKSYYNDPVFGNQLLPPVLGLSDYCQHKVLSSGRYLEKVRGNLFSLLDKRKIEENIIKISHSNRDDDNLQTQNDMYNSSENSSLFGSGFVQHAFNFKSVYYHRTKRNSEVYEEVTTFHDSWKTVDFIFYTRIFNEFHKAIEGNLKLIGRYGLLQAEEAKKIGPLPTDICPSDHFPLAAQFILKR